MRSVDKAAALHAKSADGSTAAPARDEAIGQRCAIDKAHQRRSSSSLADVHIVESMIGMRKNVDSLGPIDIQDFQSGEALIPCVPNLVIWSMVDGETVRTDAGAVGAPRPAPARQGERSGPDGSDNRLFVNAVLWVLRRAAYSRDSPERYGKWKSVHKRFSRWAKAGAWERVFETLTRDRSNEYLMLDATLVRAHQQAATGKGGTKIRLWGVPEAD